MNISIKNTVTLGHDISSKEQVTFTQSKAPSLHSGLAKSVQLALLLTPLVLVGCGGGGGGGGSSASSPSPSTPTQVTTASSNGPQAYKMDELVVPDGFDYNSVDQFDLNIDISNISTERSFVSVYSRFTTRADSTFKPDYSSKVLAGPLDNGVFASNFSAPLSEETLLIEIWFYDGQSPLQQVVASSGSQITW
ncbi:hypothetical protein [Vibrio echinoideorum]|uniref:hypothetical protein n=1 Tax=Vibrio echinoideorum TaxID=2100116 RepID=UPI00354F4F97